ncbi:MAG: hydrolase TatD [Phototrophicales bacterium]|nr:MAG: hydrolase TatD [Phototrophicales bacterium]RMG71510.1 MAG: TatD family deoxyribonuclease [Chloroflexota bacterium]
MTLIDTHCHINFERYDQDRDAVIQRAIDAGVTRIINPAIDIPTSHAVIHLTQQYPGMFCAVGIHPNSTADFTPEVIAELEALAHMPKVVAIGEIGLDYHWDKSPKSIQQRAFQAQLELAAKLELPVIIHNREASNDVMDILEAWVKGGLPNRLKDRPGVMHSFSAPVQTAERALSIGFYLGFTGPITYKNADDLRAIARTIPQNRILVETDGPFLTPHPYRGKRNEPAYVVHIVDRLASLHQLPTEQVAHITTQNAERLFQLPS